MAKFKGGPLEAAKMLAGLDRQQRENVLKEIAAKNPEMAALLRQNMVTFEDLQFLTVKMLQDFLREIDLKKLGLALRVGSEELRSHILSHVSSGMRGDIEETLNGPPQPVSKVNEVVGEIMQVVHRMVDTGKLVIRRGQEDEELV